MLTIESVTADGIVTRTMYSEEPVRVVYVLFEIGEAMRPIVPSFCSKLGTK